MNTLPLHTMTNQGYLKWETFQECKNEYYVGEVFAQAGASPRHTKLAGILFALIHSHIKGNPCRVCISNIYGWSCERWNKSFGNCDNMFYL